MLKQEAFKDFVSKHPELVSYVKAGNNTWQDFYEIYDIYGEDPKVWSKYESDDRALPLSELTNLVKGINIENVQKYIANAQKAINVIQELTAKTPTVTPPVPKSPRPITKFFGD